MCRRIRAPSVGVVAGDGASQRVLLRCHPSWRRHARDVVAPFSRRGCSPLTHANAALWLSLRRAPGIGSARLDGATWPRRRSRKASRLRRRWRRVGRQPCARRRVEAVHRSLPIRHYRPRHLDGPAVKSPPDLVRGQVSNCHPVWHLEASLRAVSWSRLLDRCDPPFPKCSTRVRRFFGVTTCLRQSRKLQSEPPRCHAERAEKFARFVILQASSTHQQRRCVSWSPHQPPT